MRLTSYANHKHLFGSLKLPFNKQKTLRTSTRPPLSEHNNRTSTSNQEPPAKTRAMSTDSNYNSSYSSSSNASSNYRSHNSSAYYQSTSRSSSSSSHCGKTYSAAGNSFNNLSSSSSIYSTASQNSNIAEYQNSSNKENSFNSSFMFNNSFNTSSNTSGSYCDLNSSMNSLVAPMGCIPQPPPNLHITNSMHMNQSMPSVYPTSKLWDRRHGNNFYQQQPLMHNTNLNGAVMAPLIMPPPAPPTQTLSVQNPSSIVPVTTESSTGLYELVNNIQMCPILYEPPKPDTPPSEVSLFEQFHNLHYTVVQCISL